MDPLWPPEPLVIEITHTDLPPITDSDDCIRLYPPAARKITVNGHTVTRLLSSWTSSCPTTNPPS